MHAGIPPPHGSRPPTLRNACWLGDTGNKWAVRILLECNLVLIVFVPYHRVSTGAMNPMNQIVQELVLKYNDPDKEDFVEAFNLLDRVSGENVRRKFNSVKSIN